MPLGHTVSDVDNAWFFNLNQSYDRIVAIASDTLANRSSDFSDCLQLPLLTHSNQPAGAVYPNPTSDYVIINGTVTDERITVYDLNGRDVLSVTAKGTSTKITLDKLVNGIYLIHHNGSNYKLLVDKN